VYVVFTRSAREDAPKQFIRPSRPFYRQPAETARPFARGSWGFELIDALRPGLSDLVLDKPRYSAFYETPLEVTLREKDVDTLLLAGTTTNCCVDSTMRDAYYRDFNVIVVSDCVAGFGGEENLHEATLQNARLLFGAVAALKDVIPAIQPVPANATSLST
jgi:ureidoacrylate peracid hydrolase